MLKATPRPLKMVAASSAFDDAQAVPNRKAQSMTSRTEIRTPGLLPDTRRLGDLRLECRVGMEAGLVFGSGSLANLLVSALLDTPTYRGKPLRAPATAAEFAGLFAPSGTTQKTRTRLACDGLTR